MQVKFHNSVLHFDKVMFFLSILIYLQSILDNMSGLPYKFYTFNLTQMFTPTGQCAKPILPLYQLCQGHWWGYESHSAIVPVDYKTVLRIRYNHLKTIHMQYLLYKHIQST